MVLQLSKKQIMMNVNKITIVNNRKGKKAMTTFGLLALCTENADVLILAAVAPPRMVAGGGSGCGGVSFLQMESSSR